MLFKCKMCGSSLEIASGETVIECEYCGTKQTLPKLDDERRANMYDRANHFRRNNEFDKAMGIYEQILNEDKTDAEAYWSLVLCQYGIEYVEDPASRKRIPTVNRAQFTSIFDDDNYRSALLYADSYQRRIYESEAKTINEIQKNILAISQREEPFDVFICYKETDNNGRRTQDSVLATELYNELTRDGFKVFFSRITLEDKLGSAYEPYIFAALNSAKVMVVLGTRPEYFNAVWVKNEWSRYLGLIKQGQRKMLIPAYKDMDPYDLPEEFSHLQAQDMSKLGFMQDLVHAIQKIAKTDEPKASVVRETVVASASTNTAPLLKRAFMFLEDGKWQEASEYCERVLDLEPENAQAYLGELMAECHAKKQENLKDCEKPFNNQDSYQKVVRFADEKLVSALNEYLRQINARLEENRLKAKYQEAENAMKRALSYNEYIAAANLFKNICNYKDSENQMRNCLEYAEGARKDAILSSAVSKMGTKNIDSCNEALESLKSISGWRYADAQIVACQKLIEKIKKRNIIILTMVLVVVASVVCIPVLIGCIINAMNNTKYDKAVALMEAGQYEQAISAFEDIKDRDCEKKIYECKSAIRDGKYNDAVALMEAGRYEEAIYAFEALDKFKDSESRIHECNVAITDGKYYEALSLMNQGNVVEAYEALIALDGYKDSAEQAESIFDQYKFEKIKFAKAGDYIFFGAYEQDRTADGKDPVEWLVLEVKDGKALVISKFALEVMTYNPDDVDVTWETCALREWLNSDFVDSAFSEEEIAIISTVTASADINPECDTNPGNATQDKVFLLSITEANKYFDSNQARQCAPTDYAFANGDNRCIDTDDGDSVCVWWLRSPGYYQHFATNVVFDGVIDTQGNAAYRNYLVRPALWIDIES